MVVDGCLVADHGLFGVNTPAISPKGTNAIDDPMTGNQPANRVSAYRRTYGAIRASVA